MGRALSAPSALVLLFAANARAQAAGATHGVPAPRTPVVDAATLLRQQQLAAQTYEYWLLLYSQQQVASGLPTTAQGGLDRAGASYFTNGAEAIDLLSHLVPGSVVVPSMVATIAVLQERYRYAYLTIAL